MKDISLMIFKCLSDKSRLRIVSNLLEEPMYVELLSERLGITSSTVSFHMKKLEEAGLVQSEKQQYYVVYKLNPEIFMSSLMELVRADSKEDENSEEALREQNYKDKVIETFFEYGKLKSIPVQEKKKKIVLEEIVKSFDCDKLYTEREVNITIADFNDDFCTIRRDLVDFGLMSRENGIYRRTR